MAEYEARFDLKKNKLKLESELNKNKLHADLQLNVNISDKYFEYEQGIASNLWVINHNLNKRPSISVVDSAGNVVRGERKYINKNTVEIRFNGAFKGKAYLN